MHFWFYQARFGDTVAVSEIVATTAIHTIGAWTGIYAYFMAYYICIQFGLTVW